MDINVGGGGIIGMADDLLQNLRCHMVFSGPTGVGMAGGMGREMADTQPLQQRVIISPAEVPLDFLPIVAG